MANNNPRSKNGSLRRKHRARLRAMGLPCALCGKPIHYDEPSDPKHPWSFVIDEKLPVSRWQSSATIRQRQQQMIGITFSQRIIYAIN